MGEGKRLISVAFTALLVALTATVSSARADSAQRELRRAGAAAPAAFGFAAWRGQAFDGRTTASGDRFDMYQLTAASAELPLNSYAAVTNLATGEQVVVRINDRPDPHASAVIVLSFAAAHRVGVDAAAPVQVKVSALGAQPPFAHAAATEAGAQPWSPDVRLAKLDDVPSEEPVQAAAERGRAPVFRARLRRPLLVTWAEAAPPVLSGL